MGRRFLVGFLFTDSFLREGLGVYGLGVAPFRALITLLITYLLGPQGL